MDNLDFFMNRAYQLARQAGALGEVPVACIIVKDQEIIAEAYNQREAHQDPTAHAEMIALRQAANHTGHWRLNGCQLFVTLEPCAMCAGAIMQAQIDTVYYGASDPKTGACGSVAGLGNLFDQSINHHTKLEAGIMAKQCGDLLRDFFRQRRLAKNESK